MKEIYKYIPGYEFAYQVSNWGRVKSLNYNNTGKERLLKLNFSCNGYLDVGLCIDGKKKTYKIHKLVAMAFLDHIPNGMKTVINHIDNNQLNNRLDNLEILKKNGGISAQRINASIHKKDVGVCWYKRDNKWQSDITINSKKIHLGRFTDKQDALDQYQLALANLHLYNGDAKAFRVALKQL